MVKYQTLDRTLAAIADPTRRDILERLARGPRSITDLARPLDITLPGLMKHVKILEEANLVSTKKNGRTRECSLGPGRLTDVSEFVDAYRKRWDGRLDRLESYVAKKKREEGKR
jgi:DNA-binding transcriptional ArsR family regulator